MPKVAPAPATVAAVLARSALPWRKGICRLGVKLPVEPGLVRPTTSGLEPMEWSRAGLIRNGEMVVVPTDGSTGTAAGLGTAKEDFRPATSDWRLKSKSTPICSKN